MLKRFWSIFIARNKEYFRDSEALIWNFVFPFFIIFGFFIMFQRGGGEEYKCGVIPGEVSMSSEISDSRPVRTIKDPLSDAQVSESALALKKSLESFPEKIRELKAFKFLNFEDRSAGFEKLRHHKLDMVLESGSDPIRYWIDATSPNGTIAESLLMAALCEPEHMADKAVKETVTGERIGYIDWLFPGIIAMNMMFSGLYGVGHVIVLYRKNGTLKRLKATPLTAFEYLAAQVVSRLFLTIFSAGVVYVGCALLFEFRCRGSYLDLILMFALGSASITSLGLVIASRISSEEFSEGLLTIITWPMMFLSEVWFSIEGAPEWIRKFSQLLPLTHMTEGMRQIMNEGTRLGDLGYHIAVLSVMTLIFILIASFLFKWVKD